MLIRILASSRIRSTIVIGLCILSIAAGFKKHIRRWVKSWDAMKVDKQDYDFPYRGIREAIQKDQGSAALGASVLYVSDRQDIPNGRRASEFFYDAQYALVPHRLLEKGAADYQLLDFFSKETLRRYIEEHPIRILFQEGAVALAKENLRAS